MNSLVVNRQSLSNPDSDSDSDPTTDSEGLAARGSDCIRNALCRMKYELMAMGEKCVEVC
jgi:hypothetical protein